MRMKLSTKGQYAVQAMVDLAMQPAGQAVSLTDIAERQALPVSYLEQLFSKLKKADLVISTRGQSGGYALARPAQSISVSDVVRAVDETVKTTRCASNTKTGCQGTRSKCLTHHLWAGLEQAIHHYLTSVTLFDVVREKIESLRGIA